jgi:hypothetical protein
MSTLEEFLAQLETYRQQSQAQREANPDQAAYWHGVRFGLELALLEAQKQLAVPSGAAPPAAPEADLDRLVFDHFERILAICQAPIKRDLLLFNVETIRDELLRELHRAAPPP